MTLTVELVPTTCWGSNLRSLLPTKDWNTVRHQVYAKAGHLCEVCRGVGRQHAVECYEVWAYESRGRRRVQRLERMIALCPSCHGFKHLGRIGVRTLEAQMEGGNSRNADLANEVRAHAKRVNGWSDEQLAAHVRAAGREHKRRSRYQWDLDLTGLARYGIDLGVVPAAQRGGQRATRHRRMGGADSWPAHPPRTWWPSWVNRLGPAIATGYEPLARSRVIEPAGGSATMRKLSRD